MRVVTSEHAANGRVWFHLVRGMSMGLMARFGNSRQDVIRELRSYPGFGSIMVSEMDDERILVWSSRHGAHLVVHV